MRRFLKLVVSGLFIVLSIFVCSAAGTQETCAPGISVVPPLRAKHDLRDELRAKLKELRTQRDNGLVSDSDYRQQKEQLRQMGKSGAATHQKCEQFAASSASLPPNFKNVIWDVVKDSFEIDSIEDPITACTLDKHKFGSIFAEMLKELNGEGGYEDSYMDFFFERDVVSSALLRFKSSERKADWVEWAEELGIEPTLEEVKAGETNEEKSQRERAAVAAKPLQS